jgi:hypothetical protein
MREYLGGIDYDEQMSLKPGRICEEKGRIPEIMAIETAQEEGKTKDKYAIEASIVARKIFGLVHMAGNISVRVRKNAPYAMVIFAYFFEASKTPQTIIRRSFKNSAYPIRAPIRPKTSMRPPRLSSFAHCSG